MKIRFIVALLSMVTLALRTADAFAGECLFPKAPEAIPNGKSASEAEMMSAMSGFKQYNSEVATYLACLDQQTAEKLKETNAGAIMQVKSLQLKKHNAAVEELTANANRFNEQVRQFKARK